jgi:hypothetical protein
VPDHSVSGWRTVRLRPGLAKYDATHTRVKNVPAGETNGLFLHCCVELRLVLAVWTRVVQLLQAQG